MLKEGDTKVIEYKDIEGGVISITYFLVSDDYKGKHIKIKYLDKEFIINESDIQSFAHLTTLLSNNVISHIDILDLTKMILIDLGLKSEVDRNEH